MISSSFAACLGTVVPALLLSAVVLAQPAPPPDGAATKPRPPNPILGDKTPAGAPAGGAPHLARIVIAFSYDNKLRVPKGSDLRVLIKNAHGADVFQRSVKTTHDAPPYTVAVNLALNGAPFKGSARLSSLVGHRFGAEFEIGEADLRAHRLGPITMNQEE
jgi:hypothetical protein